mmetsp:Transcript_70250/g.198273  ORF Transcript_70250/g.198273 Transcript_70250/m.198273 type:complete len:729 (-) Transcript_70250:26-2212(-)
MDREHVAALWRVLPEIGYFAPGVLLVEVVQGVVPVEGAASDGSPVLLPVILELVPARALVDGVDGVLAAVLELVGLPLLLEARVRHHRVHGVHQVLLPGGVPVSSLRRGEGRPHPPDRGLRGRRGHLLLRGGRGPVLPALDRMGPLPLPLLHLVVQLALGVDGLPEPHVLLLPLGLLVLAVLLANLPHHHGLHQGHHRRRVQVHLPVLVQLVPDSVQLLHDALQVRGLRAALPAVQQHERQPPVDMIRQGRRQGHLVLALRLQSDHRQELSQRRHEVSLEAVRGAGVDLAVSQGLEDDNLRAAGQEVLVRPEGGVVAVARLERLHKVLVAPLLARLPERRGGLAGHLGGDVEEESPGEEDHPERAAVAHQALDGLAGLREGGGQAAGLGADDERAGPHGEGQEDLLGQQHELVVHPLRVLQRDLGAALRREPLLPVREGLPVRLAEPRGHEPDDELGVPDVQHLPDLLHVGDRDGGRLLVGEVQHLARPLLVAHRVCDRVDHLLHGLDLDVLELELRPVLLLAQELLDGDEPVLVDVQEVELLDCPGGVTCLPLGRRLLRLRGPGGGRRLLGELPGHREGGEGEGVEAHAQRHLGHAADRAVAGTRAPHRLVLLRHAEVHALPRALLLPTPALGGCPKAHALGQLRHVAEAALAAEGLGDGRQLTDRAHGKWHLEGLAACTRVHSCVAGIAQLAAVLVVLTVLARTAAGGVHAANKPLGASRSSANGM